MRRPLAEHVPSTLVATLRTAFGVRLLETTGVLTQVISADENTGSSPTVGLFLQIVASVFIVIVVYGWAIVTANTYATIIAGRTGTIVLYRLIGASASAQRRAVAREGLAVGIVGSGLGALIGTAIIGTAITGTAITVMSISASMASGLVPAASYDFVGIEMILPIVAVVLTTWLAPGSDRAACSRSPRCWPRAVPLSGRRTKREAAACATSSRSCSSLLEQDCWFWRCSSVS